MQRRQPVSVGSIVRPVVLAQSSTSCTMLENTAGTIDGRGDELVRGQGRFAGRLCRTQRVMSGSSRVPFISPGAIVGIAVLVLLTIGSGMVDCPIYNVWSAQKAGEAEQADRGRPGPCQGGERPFRGRCRDHPGRGGRARQRNHRQEPARQRGLPALPVDQRAGAKQERRHLRPDGGQPAHPGGQPPATPSERTACNHPAEPVTRQGDVCKPSPLHEQECV
jgi:hypothetical protein